jgi:kynurenine 3-monooxygenase
MVTLTSLIPILAKRPYSTIKPRAWLPLYTMVTFRPDISYATVQKRAATQASILTALSWIGVSGLGAAGAWLTRKIFLYYIERRR